MTIYRSAGLVCVQDLGVTIVVDPANDRVHRLSGQAAMLWSWLNLGYAFPKLASLLAAALEVTQAEAERQVRATLETWSEAGLLVREEGRHG